MYHTIEEFIIDWKNESEATLNLLKNLSDASLKEKVALYGRSLGFLAWHIVISIGEMGNKAGLNIMTPPENSQPPSEASKIISEYEKSAASLETEVKNKSNNAKLFEEIEIYGEKWKRNFMLSALVKYQIHHRAQLTVLMRQTGLKVTGIYGPSKEEWSQIGMSPQN